MVVLELKLRRMLYVTMLLMSAEATDDEHQLNSSDGCIRRCGDIDVPYPFGITPECALHTNFLIHCHANSFGHTTPLKSNNLTIRRIDVDQPQMSIFFYVTRDCYDAESGERIETKNSATLETPNTMFIISPQNLVTVVGCESYLYVNFHVDKGSWFYVLDSMCTSLDVVPSGNCSVGCARTQISYRFQNMTLEAHSFKNHNSTRGFNNCSYAFVAEENEFNFSRDYITNFPQQKLPLALDWAIGYDTCVKGQSHPFCPCGGTATRHDLEDDINECENPSLHNCSETRYCVNKKGTYTCSCPSWFKGDGRKGGTGCINQLPVIKASIGVAIGVIALVISGTWLYMFSKKRKLIKLKEKFFQLNGGLILQQQLSRQTDSTETAKIFTEQELRKATNNYDEGTIIGNGGFGTVYKGILSDNRTVAIKKSKILDQNQIKQFLNEVVVVSQINHRNVVKLLGCSLETEVPLLVYEFIPNGSLFEHIHSPDKASKLVWKTRLGIAAETAGAYLHSAASTPIIHRDVKPSNILLDNHMTAKVSDFGASRLVPMDRTKLITVVQGTLGYLDPEYLHSNQLTDKSDVYSFGVVLVELLTGQKAVSFNRPEDKRNLAMHFLYSIEEGQLYEILENKIVNEGDREQLREVAELEKRCLSVKGKDRPTMKEVAMELDGIRKIVKHPWVNNTGLNSEETESLLGETSNAYKGYYGTSTSSDAITLDFTGR
ncbi:hypothetical protein FNV43_RR07130 [Rhamnella rubrinervis]|uniref:Uncharacterized protein n=1 Tax=Rhamnella rubrinervis TaxID=2594499 RepID=A0A8K0MLX2_9ROSA|nr:hypothetical protein FNV43_RR07130 [Rhamnella rubrinervis]